MVYVPDKLCNVHRHEGRVKPCGEGRDPTAAEIARGDVLGRVLKLKLGHGIAGARSRRRLVDPEGDLFECSGKAQHYVQIETTVSCWQTDLRPRSPEKPRAYPTVVAHDVLVHLGDYIGGERHGLPALAVGGVACSNALSVQRMLSIRAIREQSQAHAGKQARTS